MAEHTHTGNDAMDLSQFYQIFYEEAGENLDQMEQGLLQLPIEQTDDEALNAIFRCAHSIKGGAATFGFSDVAELTHQMESLLDKLRRHELKATPPMVDVLLESGDVLRRLLARHQGQDVEAGDTDPLIGRLRKLGRLPAGPDGARSKGAAPPAPLNGAPEDTSTAVPAGGERLLHIQVGPLEQAAQANGIVELFSDIPGLGRIEALACSVPASRLFRVRTTSSDNDLFDLFTFHLRRDQVCITEQPPVAASAAATGPGIAPRRAAEPQPTADAAQEGAGAPRAAPWKSPVAAPADANTLRVAVDKVDRLINLVGELVITQTMLAQKCRELGTATARPLMDDLASLDRHTRDLQDAVMSIRMTPMSVVFNRFPRMLRDLAHKLGKEVVLTTQGESTELDKSLVEKITDPLTHLLRNCCDHGIETPAQRLAAGKPGHGSIVLSAAHRGGSIVIEVGDDGRGLSRSTLLEKARQRGLAVSDRMSDSEVWHLIFAPGFSTAAEVSDVSGRGVGMDVVKKNIHALGGTVDLRSTEGLGMCVSIRLPLTLAIMDGMSVRVGSEIYLLPLSGVVESFQVRAGDIRAVVPGVPVIEVREQFLPVLELERVFQVPRPIPCSQPPVAVVAEADGLRVALVVDELLGQQQVVVKNLESNYRKVAHVSGASILGNGKVALILDLAGLVAQSRH